MHPCTENSLNKYLTSIDAYSDCFLSALSILYSLPSLMVVLSFFAVSCFLRSIWWWITTWLSIPTWYIRMAMSLTRRAIIPVIHWPTNNCHPGIHLTMQILPDIQPKTLLYVVTILMISQSILNQIGAERINNFVCIFQMH